MPSFLAAALIVVTTTAPDVAADGQCSLVEAIVNANTAGAPHADCASGASATTIQLGPVTYVLHGLDNTIDDGVGLPPIVGDITIEGNGATIERSTSDATPPFRLIFVSSRGRLTLRNLTLRNGFANADGSGFGGGAILNTGALTMQGCTITANRSGTDGGGLATTGGAVLIENSNVSMNTAAGAGGGARSRGGNIVIKGSKIRQNSATGVGDFVRGGGIANHAIDGDAAMTLDASSVTENTTDGIGGGGIDNAAASGRRASLSLQGTTVSSNSAAGADHTHGLGGGIQNSFFRTSNNATAEVTVVRSILRDNTGINGGGVSSGFDLARTLTQILVIDSSTISGNTAAGSGFQVGNGGGVYTLNGSTTIVNSTLSGNRAAGTGAASGFGGALMNAGLGGRSGTVTLTNTTLAGNSAATAGAALANLPFNGSATSTSANVLFARNKSPGGSCVAQGGLVSNGHNLEDGNTCGLTHPSDIAGAEPLIGTLRSNDAFTPTHALLPGSPGIDAGEPAVCASLPVGGVDQRGVPRTTGAGCDIGAFESAWPAVAARLDTAFATNTGVNGTRAFALLVDGRFVDQDGAAGAWIPLSAPAGVGMRYDPADGCGALWVGRFASAATLNGFLACGDGSTTAGLWGGRLLPP